MIFLATLKQYMRNKFTPELSLYAKEGVTE